MASAPLPTPQLFARALLAPYLLALLLITWLPAEAAGRVTGIVARIAEMVAARGFASFGAAYTVLEFLANVALFVPLGALLMTGWRRMPWWLPAAGGFALSALIELGQISLPSRFPTLSDLIANTLGALAGAVLVRLGQRMWRANARLSSSAASSERADTFGQ